MNVPRLSLAPDYSISRIIKGGWHLAGGHGPVDEARAIEDMRAFVEAGITTFDCADIYTGVERLIGKFLNQYQPLFASGELPAVQIHTKYVPDFDALSTLKKSDTEKIIDRSLRRLGVEQLDLVQFHWWDYEIPGYVETALNLQSLVTAGKIKRLGLTNFDGMRSREMLDAGVRIATSQVQYSMLDQRPATDLDDLATVHHMPFLCYGTLAGGFISDRFRGRDVNDWDHSNRSLIKYRLIIDEFGGYDRFQELLTMLAEVAMEHTASISQVAMNYMLNTKNVAAVIVGARNSRHIDSLLEVFSLNLSDESTTSIRAFLAASPGPRGPVYHLERDKEGIHGRIMRYNLNEKEA